jgi:hypothetical protein
VYAVLDEAISRTHGGIDTDHLGEVIRVYYPALADEPRFLITITRASSGHEDDQGNEEPWQPAPSPMPTNLW